jgi:FdhD protein/cysteine desulfurase
MMKIEEIDAINFKDDRAIETREKVVKDETITLTINGNISRSMSAIEDSLKEFAVGYLSALDTGNFPVPGGVG